MQPSMDFNTKFEIIDSKEISISEACEIINTTITENMNLDDTIRLHLDELKRNLEDYQANKQ